MKRLPIFLCLALALSGAALSQERNPQSTATLIKMRQVDLLNMLIPLAMKKEQIRAILPEIEKARRDVKAQEDEEAKLLAQKSAALDKAVKDGIDKGDVPDKQFLKDLNALIRFFAMKRDAVANDNTDKVLAVVKATFNAGQLKAMANSLNMSAFDPGIKKEEIKEDDKLKFFVREILLDPLCYDLLVKMQSGQRG